MADFPLRCAVWRVRVNVLALFVALLALVAPGWGFVALRLPVPRHAVRLRLADGEGSTTVETALVSTTELADVANGIKYVPLTRPDEVFDCAALCMEVFFNEKAKGSRKGVSAALSSLLPLKALRTFLCRQLYRKLSSAMLATLKQPYRSSIYAVDTNSNQIVGYVEVYMSEARFVLDEVSKNLHLSISPDTASLPTSRESSAMPKIANLAVSPNARKAGIGRQLVLRCIALSRMWGAQELYLTVEPDNAAALSLYAKMGFEMRHLSKGMLWDVEGLTLRKVPRLLSILSLKLQ